MDIMGRLVFMLLFLALIAPSGVSCQFLLGCIDSDSGCHQRCIEDSCDGGQCHIHHNHDEDDESNNKDYNLCFCYGCLGQSNEKIIRHYHD
ncbi:Hypothetical predicted protein [Octopus vulgaris]|uniref:Uncharacterized protein n=1 Tax=Octopus vulgaris TaxID=6645 RepID=A0AA36BZ81_OCTVU|nr:Hypothetical predicted protein [Octopus vulgaris]